MPEISQKEMDQINHTLKHQDNQLQEILFCLKGSASLGIEGLIPSVKSLKTDVNEIKAWQTRKLILKNKFDYITVGKFVAWTIGTIGAVVGLFQAVKMAF